MIDELGEHIRFELAVTNAALDMARRIDIDRVPAAEAFSTFREELRLIAAGCRDTRLPLN